MPATTIDLSLDRLPDTPSPDRRAKPSDDQSRSILRRAHYLAADDRALLHSIYAESRTASEVASLRNEDPRVLRRRIRALLARLDSPRFEFILRHRPFFSPLRRRIATICIIQGHSIRNAADRTGLSMHTVRQHLHAIDALYETARTHKANQTPHTHGAH